MNQYFCHECEFFESNGCGDGENFFFWKLNVHTFPRYIFDTYERMRCAHIFWENWGTLNEAISVKFYGKTYSLQQDTSSAE